MKAITKFEIGQLVWTIEKGKAIVNPVHSIDVCFDQNSNIKITYWFFTDEKICYSRPESELFQSKELLIENL